MNTWNISVVIVVWLISSDKQAILYDERFCVEKGWISFDWHVSLSVQIIESFLFCSNWYVEHKYHLFSAPLTISDRKSSRINFYLLNLFVALLLWTQKQILPQPRYLLYPSLCLPLLHGTNKITEYFYILYKILSMDDRNTEIAEVL